jgi:hypothetical protein
VSRRQLAEHRPGGAGLAKRDKTPQEKKTHDVRITARNQGFTYGVIAPDPSLDITETPTRGMNSHIAWTVFRVTMSFYGVAHDRLPLGPSDQGRGGSRVRNPCHSLRRRELPQTDRQKGVWCITRALPGSVATVT